MIEDAILQHVPNTKYFDAYMEYTHGGEECPRFRFFVAATTYGAMINRKVLFQRSTPGVFPKLYPNLWTVLVAPQGVGHKSSTLGVGKSLLLTLPLEDRPKFLSAKITPEAIVKSLASHALKIKGPGDELLTKDAIGVIYSSELGVLLGRERYNVGLVSLLTALYDCEDEWASETIMRGDQVLSNICLTFFAAITPDWLQSMLPQDAFKTGFMSRFLWVAQPRGWDVKVADPPAVNAKWRDALHEELVLAANYKGEASWDKEGRKTFIDWYDSINFKDLPGVVASAFERMQEHLLRLAIIIQVSKGSLIITKETMRQSIALLESIFPESSTILEYIATEPGVRPAVRILEELRHKPIITEGELLRKVWRSLPRLTDWTSAINILIRSELVKPATINNESGYLLNVKMDSSLSEYKKKELLAEQKRKLKGGSKEE